MGNGLRDNVNLGSTGEVRTASAWGYSWGPVDSSAGRQTDNTARPTDNTAIRTGNNGRVLEVRYGDPNLDHMLASGNYDTLKISGFPQGAKVSSWMDDKGFFFWYKGGNDNKAHHYIPSNLKTIDVNGYSQNVDELRIAASQSFLAEQNKAGVGFSSVNSRTSPIEFARSMSHVSDQALQLEQKMLADAAQHSPNNPYFRIYLADTMIAQAMKPIVQQVENGQNFVSLNDPDVIRGLQGALAQVKQAETIAQKSGNLRIPNMEMMPGLYPFALNPYQLNPDMYWGGALYQAYQREVILNMALRLAPLAPSLELPPNLPGR